tara:strand:+ start:67 stop:366 length:300 start_codon:yes stop_codon:yes gene_type:complete
MLSTLQKGRNIISIVEVKKKKSFPRNRYDARNNRDLPDKPLLRHIFHYATRDIPEEANHFPQAILLFWFCIALDHPFHRPHSKSDVNKKVVHNFILKVS